MVWRRILAALLVLGGALCWVLVLANTQVRSYYRLRLLLDHPVLFTGVGTLAFALAWGLAVRGTWLKWIPVALLCVAAVGFAGLALLAVQLRTPLTEQQRIPSPDGRRMLIEYRSSGAMSPDPTLEFRMRTEAGLLSRETDLGCVNLDSDRLRGVQWVDPDTVRIDIASAGPTEITVDRRGKPDRVLSAGC